MPAAENNEIPMQTIGQVVSELSAEYSDITHSSLRFLEREGFILPKRTAGGHRLFPPDQVERIRLIKSWQRQRLSLEDIKQRLAAADQLPDLQRMASQLLSFLVSGDREAARRLILDAFDAGVAIEDLFDEVFQPVLHETGEKWETGEISVGQEKEISFFLRDLIVQLGARSGASVDADGPTVIAACVEGENHELGLRMIATLLRARAYTVHYLGPNVSPAFLIERIEAREPDAVLIGIALSENLDNLSRTLTSIRESGEPATIPAVIIGGAGLPDEWSGARREGIFQLTAPTLVETVDEIDRLVGGGPRRS